MKLLALCFSARDAYATVMNQIWKFAFNPVISTFQSKRLFNANLVSAIDMQAFTFRKDGATLVVANAISARKITVPNVNRATNSAGAPANNAKA